jgi:hypothetical protein
VTSRPAGPQPPSDLEELDLADVHDLIWDLLAEGVQRASSPFHTPALATSSGAGVEVRTVVLRHADPQARTISCHTDWRSPKRRQIERDPRVSWLFYDRDRKVQLRLRGGGRLHQGDEYARSRWAESTARSRVCYSTPCAPGTLLAAPAAGASDPEAGWHNFAVLICTLGCMDFLYLSAAGHRRAVLRWDGRSWSPSWLSA